MGDKELCSAFVKCDRTFGNCLSSKAGAVEEEAESILRLRPRHQHNGHAVSLADHCSTLSPLCLCGSSFLHDGQRLGAHSGLQWVLRQPNLQAIWLWFLGSWIGRIWKQDDGVKQTKLPLWRIHLIPIHMNPISLNICSSHL